MADAMEKMVGIRFRAENKEDGIYMYIYHQGRKDMCMELLNFDAATLATAKEAATQQLNSES